MHAHRTTRTFLLFGFVLCASTAFAQYGGPLGTLEATFQGEERSWTTYDYPEHEEEGVPASAHYVPFPGGLMGGSIDGYPEGTVEAVLDFYPGENSEAEPGEKEPIRLEGDLSTKVVPDRDVSIE